MWYFISRQSLYKKELLKSFAGNKKFWCVFQDYSQELLVRYNFVSVYWVSG